MATSLDAARRRDERQLLIRSCRGYLIGAGVLLVGQRLLSTLAQAESAAHGIGQSFVIMVQGWTHVYDLRTS